MMKKQVYFTKSLGPRPVATIRSMGVDEPEGACTRVGRSWARRQTCRDETFSLVALEAYHASADAIGYTRQEDYVKINFWLSGKHITVLDGYGQFEHTRPEVFITSSPFDMIKIDLMKREAPVGSLGLCVLRDFFPKHMGLAAQELPEPLRSMVVPDEKPCGFHSLPLTADIVSAVHAILAAPFAVRQEPLYAQAKAVELMCLVLNRLRTGNNGPGMDSLARHRHESRLHEARELVARRYAEPITLERISREVGLNKMALTAGFRELFGMSVYDCLQKVRMERAYELLQDRAYTVTQVAEAVGYSHACNFSTAFRARFGCTPHEARSKRGS